MSLTRSTRISSAVAERGGGEAAASKYLPQSKQQNMTVFKNVVVFKYMRPNSTEFTHSAKVVVCNFSTN